MKRMEEADKFDMIKKALLKEGKKEIIPETFPKWTGNVESTRAYSGYFYSCAARFVYPYDTRKDIVREPDTYVIGHIEAHKESMPVIDVQIITNNPTILSHLVNNTNKELLDEIMLGLKPKTTGKKIVNLHLCYQIEYWKCTHVDRTKWKATFNLNWFIIQHVKTIILQVVQ